MNKPCLNFSVPFISDGISTTVEIDTVSGPISYFFPYGTVLNDKTFNERPTDAVNLSLDESTPVSKVSLTHGVLTVDLGTPTGVSGSIHAIVGVFVY